MIETITQEMFIQRFEDYGRKNQFSYEALRALYGYLENAYDGDDDRYELDVIGICCDFSEVNKDDYLSDNNLTMQELLDLTTVIELENSIIIGNY